MRRIKRNHTTGRQIKRTEYRADTIVIVGKHKFETHSPPERSSIHHDKSSPHIDDRYACIIIHCNNTVVVVYNSIGGTMNDANTYIYIFFFGGGMVVQVRVVSRHVLRNLSYNEIAHRDISLHNNIMCRVYSEHLLYIIVSSFNNPRGAFGANLFTASSEYYCTTTTTSCCVMSRHRSQERRYNDILDLFPAIATI